MRSPTLLTAVTAALAVTLTGGALVATQATAAPTAPTAASGAAEALPLAGLKVLITNDDSAQGRDTRYGTDGRGLYELRRAMCGAGADVLVVAPWQQQSGASARMAAPGLQPVGISVAKMTVPAAYADDCADSDVAADGAGVYGVCLSSDGCTSTSPSGSPADAVSVALTRFVGENFWSDGPDLVLSGTNFGHNVAASVNHSGTVGAVVTAMEHHVPAIAVSSEVAKDLAKIGQTPFVPTANFAVELVSRLRAQHLLTPDLALNVNFPFLEAGESAGKPLMTVVGESNDCEYECVATGRV